MSEQISASCSLVVVSALMLAVVGCGSDVTPEGSGGTTSGGGGATSNAGAPSTSGAATMGTPLTWDTGGFVSPEANPFAIQGPFYSYSDCDPPSGLPCTMPDASLTGADGKPGWSVGAAGVCAKGTAVKVENAMFSAQWGMGLALDLNSKGGEAGAPAEKGTFDLTAAKIRGFAVDIAGTAPSRIRINLTMPGVADSSFVDAQIPGTTTFALADAKQGAWVTEKTPLDPTHVEALQFQVFTTAATATPYDFCITGIRAISDAATAAVGTGGGQQ